VIDWHRLFGLVLRDFLLDSPFGVELEKDLSLKQQFLDVVVVRKRSGGVVPDLPDGLSPLADHNLISFKSHQEAFDSWAMKELLGHYVNYRKQVSPSPDRLLPEDQFRLFAVSARFPDLLSSRVALSPVQDGVYDCRWGDDTVRVIVLRELPLEERNAVLQLFSAVPAQVVYARDHYRQRDATSSTLIQQLLKHYGAEGLQVPYTIEDFLEDVKKETLEECTVEERLAGLTPQQIVQVLPSRELAQAMPTEVRLEGISPQDRLKGISPEDRLIGLSAEDRLQGLSPEQVEDYLKRLKGDAQSGPS
jgi:hypothetical protein